LLIVEASYEYAQRDKLRAPRSLELAVKTDMPRALRHIKGQLLVLSKLDQSVADHEARRPITITCLKACQESGLDGLEILGTKFSDE